MQMLKINTGTVQRKNLAFKTQHDAMRKEISEAQTENKDHRDAAVQSPNKILCEFLLLLVL